VSVCCPSTPTYNPPPARICVHVGPEGFIYEFALREILRWSGPQVHRWRFCMYTCTLLSSQRGLAWKGRWAPWRKTSSAGGTPRLPRRRSRCVCVCVCMCVALHVPHLASLGPRACSRLIVCVCVPCAGHRQAARASDDGQGRQGGGGAAEPDGADAVVRVSVCGCAGCAVYALSMALGFQTESGDSLHLRAPLG
jgi:hypothetical protein